jgi:acyltransferase
MINVEKLYLRSSWIDTLKGIGIILVVIGHLSANKYDNLVRYIYSFHMPLFFFISGYLFNLNKYREVPLKFLQKKVKTLLLPYLTFTVISYDFYMICDFLLRVYQPAIYNENILGKGIYFNLINIFLTQKELINTPLWFLLCLFTVEILFYLISRKYYKSQNNILYFIIFLSFVGYICSNYGSTRFPWKLDVAFTAISFYAVGFFFHNHYDKLFLERKVYIFFILLILHLVSCFKNESVNMISLSYGNYILFYISAFSGIYAYFYLAQTVQSSKVLEYYGKNSLIILGVHYIIISLLKYAVIFSQKMVHININQNFVFVITIISVLVLIVPIVNFINKHLSFILGDLTMDSVKNKQ